VVFRRPEELKCGEIYVSSENLDPIDDPNPVDYYAVPVILLVGNIDGSSEPEDVLFWYPTYGQFGQCDREHTTAIRFAGVGWNDIVCDPVRFLNAKWTCDEPTAVWVQPWCDEHHDCRSGEPPW
jgi:hypothetical protein